MVLEAVMICMDNSDWMRNGDFLPTRLQAQNEAVNSIAVSKTNSNMESTVGVMTMAKRVQVLLTPSRDLGRLMNAIEEEVKCGGVCNFIAALKTASLALKNRQNKNQAQRIILFVGSPVEHDKNELIKLAKAFKKNAVAVDVINFGAENTINENAEKLEAFVSAVKTNDNSHLINIPQNPMIPLSELILNSPIMVDSSAPSSSGAAREANLVQGVDPNQDPELAMALRLSMEDALAHQTQVAQQISQPAGGNASSAAAASIEEEDPMLAQAIALSLAADGGDVGLPSESQSKAADAMDTSSSGSKPAASSAAPAEAKDEDVTDALNDPNFIENLLESVGVSKDDIQIDDILSSIQGDKDKKDKDEKDKKDNKDKDTKQ